MRLAKVAEYFNTMPCVDAYTSKHCFDGQLGTYDDNKRDSETAERRVLSLAAGATLPARRVIKAAGQTFIIGSAYPDWHRDEVIRVAYVLHEAADLASVYTLAQLAANQAGVSAYAGRNWVKYLAASEQRSDLAPQHHVHFAKTESIANEQIVLLEGRYLFVRAWNYGPAGTLVALADELPEPVVETVMLTGGTRDPVTATWSGTPTAVRVVRVRWQSLFSYRANIAPKFGPEDLQVVVAKSVFTPADGMLAQMSDGAYLLQSVHDEGAVWLCRATRHG